MNLEKFFSFDEDILPLIKESRASRKKGVHSDLEKIKQESNAHIVGQVTDDILLFTWDDKTEKSEKEVTFFCLYDMITKKPSVLFDHDRKVDVVTASLNEERTLLAFTVIEFKSSLDNPDEETVGIYKSFIAEIYPKNRVFSLAVERPQYQRVQFLYGKYPLHGGSARKESHMLFFHHTESIDLYHIPLARIDDDGMLLTEERVHTCDRKAETVKSHMKLYQNAGNDIATVNEMVKAMQSSSGVAEVTVNLSKLLVDHQYRLPAMILPRIMSGQPQVENLVKGFVWAQLDRLNKRLYYVYPADESTKDPKEKTTEMKPLIFTAIQFCEKSPRVITVKMPCPFPVNSNVDYTGGRFQYDRKTMTNVIAESNVNMQVLTLPDGSFSLCYQHSLSENQVLYQGSNLSDEETDESVDSLTQESFLEYSVLMFHHDDCIAVILPGYVFHLLDCNAEHPPCHHLVLKGPDSVELPPCGRHLSDFVCINNETTSIRNLEELLLFEPSLSKVFQLRFANKYWTDCFLSTHRDSTRLALLHFSILHIQDPEIVSRIFSHLAGDPAILECESILKEYLIGSTYFQMKFQVDRSVYKLLPFSSTEPFRGQLVKDRCGKKIARISYSSFKTSDIFAHNFKGEKRKEIEFWISLKQNVSLAKSVERFCLKKVAMPDDEQSSNTPLAEEYGFTSIFRKLRKFSSVEPNMLSNPESFQENVPRFMDYVKPDSFSKSEEERNNTKVLESLTRYLHHYLPSEVPKLKIQSMAVEYTRCQKKQSSSLLDLFWEGLTYTEETHPYYKPLSKRGSSRDCALFMLLERYHVTVKALRFPFPTGFQTFFTSMGFRCLEPKLFVQYVSNGIFELGNEFMHRLLEDVGSDESYSHLISRLISGFEQAKAIHLLKKWNSPSATRLLCQRYVSNLLAEESMPLQNDSRDFLSQSQRFDEYEKTVSTLLDSTDDSRKLQTVPFRPLVNVLTSLETTVLPGKKTRDAKGTGGNQRSTSNSELKFVARHAMQHTANEVDDSLGLLAF